MTMSKSHKKWIMWVIVIAVSFSVGFLVRQPAGASTAEPGSSADPITAKSYVDEAAHIVTFKTVTLHPPAKLVASQGVEIIVREGTAKAIEGTSGGLSDVTDGRNIRGGEIIPTNHHIVISRTDGRGFEVVSSRVIILIKGEFSIK